MVKNIEYTKDDVYVKVCCAHCEIVDFAKAYVSDSPGSGYCSAHEIDVEVDEMPEGWGTQFTGEYNDPNSTEQHFCKTCADKIEKDTGFRPWR